MAIDFRSVRDTRASAFDFIQVRIASPEEIRGPRDSKERERLEMAGVRNWWSWGEVTKPETINYRSFKPEKDGLFCERIFGPVKDWECHCGKYKRIRYRGVICDRCGVEVTLSKVRRERMGHIELAVPVAHIWYFGQRTSYIATLLDISKRDLERIIYYSNYVVIDKGNQEIENNELLDEDKYLELKTKAREEGDTAFLAGIGADGVREALRRVDVDRVADALRYALLVETSGTLRKRLHRRLKIVDAFRNSGESGDVRNKPEWMILDVIPVIPPDLRPFVPLDGGRFATSDLNDLYRRVIVQNNKLRLLLGHQAPSVILRNDGRKLQEAVDALFDNGRRSKAIRGRGKRPLKSLSDMLKGKQGRFRQNLLGKRVDYSGRSVIVVGPELKLHQCGLPKLMALELFKPFIIHKLVEKGIAETVKRAKKIVERESPEVYEILEEIIRDHPVLLNRAPTLHRLGIQAFEPVLVEGKAIRIHPLVCAAFNADFDGDQMAVHVPLSFEAQLEARLLMLSSNNILKPSDGRPVAEPSQDIVLGCYVATKAPADFATVQPTRRYATVAEVEMELALGRVTQQTAIMYRVDDEAGARWEKTTIGRAQFNAIIPKELGFKNHDMKKKALSELVFESYRQAGLAATVQFLDRLKEFGFANATRGGVSIGIEDLHIPREKDSIVAYGRETAHRIERQYAEGMTNRATRTRNLGELWDAVSAQVSVAQLRTMRESQGGANPLWMIYDSGARGSAEQLRRLGGTIGILGNASSYYSEKPLRQGLGPDEFFRLAAQGRDLLIRAAPATQDAGYFARRLANAAHDVVVTEQDCGTIMGLEVGALKEGEDVIEPLAERIVGNVAAEDIEDPHEIDESGRPTLLAEAGELISEETAQAIEDSGLETVRIRSVLTCEAKRGLCRMCYGRNLATMAMVDIGEAVGIIAAQTLSEPLTQLSLDSKHRKRGNLRHEQGIQRSRQSGRIEYSDRLVAVTNREGQQIVTGYEGEIIIRNSAHPNSAVSARLQVPLGAILMMKDGDEVRKDQVIFTWDPYSNPIIADVEGTVKFVDLVEDESVSEELDELTGLRQRVVIEDREKKLHAHIEIWQRKEVASGHWHQGAWREYKARDVLLPVGAHLLIQEDQQLAPGDIVAEVPIVLEHQMTSGQLAVRVTELLEARNPKGAAVLSEIDGVVSFGDIVRNKRQIFIRGQPASELDEDIRLYEVGAGKHLRVHEGDRVRAGDRLSEGPVNPHDILRIKGARAVQEYLLNEVQEVYRLQGVKINDKHIGVIVRQMLQKVRVLEAGDTEFLEGEHVDKQIFRDENDRMKKHKETPSTAEPLLLGITKASLTTQSFISAASFQETTRVLTDASIRGAKDDLLGLKENIIIGHLIPAGTGMYRYQDVELEGMELPAPPELAPLPELPNGFAMTDEEEKFPLRSDTAGGDEQPERSLPQPLATLERSEQFGAAAKTPLPSPEPSPKTWNRSMTIQVSEIAAKQMAEPDDDGDVWFATKAVVASFADAPVEVSIVLQAIDADGFELKDVALRGELAPGATRTITDRAYMPYTDFLAIANWQIKSTRTYDL